MGPFYNIKNVRYDTEYIGYNAPGGKPNPGQHVIGTDSLTAMKGSLRLFPTTTCFFSWLIMGDPVLVRPLCLRETLGTLVRNGNSRSKFEIPLFIVTVYHVVIMLFV